MDREPIGASTANTTTVMPSTQKLIQIAYQHYPYFDPKREQLHEFRERAPLSPELRKLYDLVAETLSDNRAWHALLADVKARYPEYWLADGRPPGVDIPSYQLVLAYEQPDSKHSHYLSFRISLLAPVFDFYETERGPDSRLIARYLRPTPASANIARAVADVIEQRLHYTWLDPDVGATPLPGLWVDDHDPGDATLADALFEGARRW